MRLGRGETIAGDEGLMVGFLRVVESACWLLLVVGVLVALLVLAAGSDVVPGLLLVLAELAPWSLVLGVACRELDGKMTGGMRSTSKWV